MTEVIQLQELTKTYGKDRGIRDVTLSVQQGEIFGFLGPNGAGKTTALRTMLGLMAPTSGRATILGLDSQSDTVEILKHVGNLPTEFALDDRMTGREILTLFAKLRDVTDLSFGHELAQRFDASLDRPIRKLSRGNKQKIGIIQAMFHQPQVIVLDEPTGGLDPLMQETFLRLLTEAKERGQTIFFSSHNLSEIERIADRVGIIRDGLLVAVEDPSTLTEQAFRHVRIRLAEAPTPETAGHFRELPGVEHVMVEDSTITLQAHGNLDTLIKTTAQQQISSIDIERPALEEIFLSYYGVSGETNQQLEDER